MNFNLNMFSSIKNILGYKEDEYKDDRLNIFTSFDKNDIYSIDPTESIIICTINDKNIVKKQIDGSFGIITDYDIFSNKIKNNKITFNHYSEIKLSIPVGIKLLISEPLNSHYYHKIYNKLNYEYKDNNIVITNFDFDLELDLERFKNSNSLLNIKRGSILYELNFINIISNIKNEKTEVKNFYIIKDSELYDNFDF